MGNSKDRNRAARLTLLFSSLGHAFMHYLTAFFFVVVLGLELAWERPYHELIGLWTLGALLVGLCALPAGWIADRWHAPGMMIVMFLGLGTACLFCALVDSPSWLLVGLAALGVFASIYHPVGIAWVVRSSEASGKALGINGIFGGLGVAGAGVVTGFLIDAFDWRAAFFVPGIGSVLAGIALWYCLAAGLVDNGRTARSTAHEPHRTEMLKTFAILLVTMFCLGFIYQATQTAFPKVFDQRLADWVGTGTLGVGVIITVVYSLAALMQLIGGHLADRYPLKWVYFGSFLLQVPVLVAVGYALGFPLIAVATLSVLLATGALPAENMLLARHSPDQHQSLAFGVKFVLAFGTAPLAIWFVSRIMRATGELGGLFVTLAVLATIAVVAALALPGEREGVGSI